MAKSNAKESMQGDGSSNQPTGVLHSSSEERQSSSSSSSSSSKRSSSDRKGHNTDSAEKGYKMLISCVSACRRSIKSLKAA
ncbi:hypothetical protein ACLOJK_002850 [Asimina triloba]